jgi:hypothetical protein
MISSLIDPGQVVGFCAIAGSSLTPDSNRQPSSHERISGNPRAAIELASGLPLTGAGDDTP